jgi:hypothetical protein
MCVLVYQDHVLLGIFALGVSLLLAGFSVQLIQHIGCTACADNIFAATLSTCLAGTWYLVLKEPRSITPRSRAERHTPRKRFAQPPI